MITTLPSLDLPATSGQRKRTSAGAAPVFLLFSGHNDRAVVTLCRYFRQQQLGSCIVAAGRDDAVHCTDYRGQVAFNRTDKVVDIGLLAGLAGAASGPLVYCPTTEYINDYALANRDALEAAGLTIGLPPRAVYEAVTGKLSSQELMQRWTGVQPPPAQAIEAARAPCVLKPRRNLVNGRVQYPLLCRTDTELAAAKATINPADWFAQDYVQGQSHYLCGYLSRSGERAWYWQDNLLQQPGGKSIVLARTGSNPGFDTEAFFAGLQAIGYHGPLMLELIQDAAGRLHYIEINPRFWGPLQLALDACPRVLTLFARDHGAVVPDLPEPETSRHYYAWGHGAQTPGCKRYPAAEALAIGETLADLLVTHDIYGQPDTQALHMQH